MCKLFKVGSYPTLNYFTDDLLQLDGPAKFYRFADNRNMATLEKFTLDNGYLDANWKHVPEDDEAKERTPIINFSAISEELVEDLKEIGQAFIEPVYEVEKVLAEPFSGKKSFWEVIGTDVRRLIIIGLCVVPIALLLLCIIGFNKKAKPIKKRRVDPQKNYKKEDDENLV